MDREVRVFVDIHGSANLVGRLWIRSRNARETSTFIYDDDWLTSRLSFDLSPDLPLGTGAYHAENNIFGVFRDAAPDRRQRPR